MQGDTGVRASWGAEPVLQFQTGAPGQRAESGTAVGQETATPGRQGTLASRSARRARRPGGADAASGGAATPRQPAQAPAGWEQAKEAPQARFMFATPGAGPTDSAGKARRASRRTPAADATAAAGAAPSPAFSANSTASMAWSPYPTSADAGGATRTPVTPGSATPTSAPAPTYQGAGGGSPVESVAADLQSRLNLSGHGGSHDSASGSGSLPDELRDKLSLNMRQTAAAAAAAAERAAEARAAYERAAAAAAQAAAAARATAAAGSYGAAPGRASASAAAPAPAAARFSFVFGGAASVAAAPSLWPAPSPKAARPAGFKKKSPSSSPAAARHASASGSAPASPQSAYQAPAGGFQQAPAAPREAATAAGPAAAPEATASPPAGSFVFGSSSGSPAALRARHRARQQRSPEQRTAAPLAAPAEQSAQAPAAPAAAPPSQQQPAAAAWAAAFSGTAPVPEPLREQQQQQQQQQPGYVRLGDLGKQGATSPGFAAAGAAARRPPRRKTVHAARSSFSSKPAARQAWPSAPAAAPMRPEPAAPAQAPPAPAAAAAVQPPAAAAAPAVPASEWDAQTTKAYSTSELFRSQGNEAFRDGKYATAYELYTKALHALWPHPPLHSRLALLLSNRAAALLSQGKPLSALADCQMGLTYDPDLMRCALRIATCHSRMGDFDEAFEFVTKLRDQAAGNVEHLKEISFKQRDLEEQERQMYAALRSLGHPFHAPQRDTDTGGATGKPAPLAAGPSGSSAAPANAEAFWEALKKVDDIAPHVPHSELLVAAKAEGLLRLGRHDKSREFCGQLLHLDDGPHRQQQKRAPWRLWVQAQCSWQEGDTGGGLKQQLQELFACLEQQQAATAAAGGAAQQEAAAASAFFPAAAASGAAAAASEAALPGPSTKQELRRRDQLAQLVGLPSSSNVKGLLEGLEAADRLRLAGNAAVKAGKAEEAVQKYTEALAAASGLSPAIAAVLLSNRAAAHQHLKRRALAVADCSRAVALSPHYAKAFSRLATLLTELGYHSDAANALEAAAAAPGVSAKDRREYQQRLQGERSAARRVAARGGGLSQPTIDHYLLLGIERTTAVEDVRRAYKKLALQLHPDKAASVVRVSIRCCGCGSAAYESLAAQERLGERATWLFKLLGEASEVLSDATKRRELDHNLAMWGTSSSSAYGGYGASGGAGYGRGPPAGGGFTSYYGTADEEDEDSYYDTYFSNMFGGRRYGASAGTGRGGYGGGTGAGTGASNGRGGARRYGAGSRYWGFG